ncbi:unnamed protein product (macronuclear) [Paramecium tetraurelia]|uniref:Ribose-5-phosphate isomerase n=1 Tax=Paramecium tetraurelia TaxID=5888 RepID=A0CWS7_PARTE|nr:uncharacterized protein GSPATT00001447001 [Paramecium tetraurelia]CAK75244.1 unnamed protein product [Paramecium tetraurelia]|eukprot:XP_001442641.1 hypothetical protein (macronuclear) [Paramecium tetraurelia strain d4-2]
MQNIILVHCKKKNYQIDDKGTFSNQSCDYNDYAVNVCDEVIKSNGIGILTCGSGVGISMMANKVKGIRCGQVNDYDSTLKAIEIGCNVISFGARIVGIEIAKQIIDTFLSNYHKIENNEVEKEISRIKEENYKK